MTPGFWLDPRKLELTFAAIGKETGQILTAEAMQVQSWSVKSEMPVRVLSAGNWSVSLEFT